MSINDKLQTMLSCDEKGIFLTDEKKKELQELNEGVFSGIGELGGDLFNIIKYVTKKMGAIASVIGKKIANQLRKIDEKTFTKKMGAKDIEEIDKNLSQLKVNDPEFLAVLKEVMIKKRIAKKSNKELYESLNDVFQRHMERSVKYYQNLLKSATDKKQATMYYAILLDMLPWLEKPEDKILRDTVLSTIASYLDTQTLKPEEVKREKLTPEEQQLIANPESIDLKANELAKNSPELIQFVKRLAIISAKIPRTDKAYGEVHDIFNRNMDRLIDYYDRMLNVTKDENEALKYNGILVDIANSLDATEHKAQKDKIKKSIHAQADRAVNNQLKDLEAKMKKESEEMRKESKGKTDETKKTGKEMPEENREFTEQDIYDIPKRDLNLNNFNQYSLKEYLKAANEYIKKVNDGDTNDMQIKKAGNISDGEHMKNIIAKVNLIKDKINHVEELIRKPGKK